VKIEASIEIDKPIADVWRWYAEDHVRNHPRWNPDLEVEQISDGPIGVGTKIRRRSTMGGTPVDGEMEVTEFDPPRAMGVSISDGGYGFTRPRHARGARTRADPRDHLGRCPGPR
jgi:uncharacterized protein YndB with AHSA1/START domain